MKDKFLIFLTFILILLVISLVVFAKKVEQVEKEQVEHIVMRGENLTQIANKYYSDTYLPKAIHKIKKDNKLLDSDLKIGQILKVEVK